MKKSIPLFLLLAGIVLLAQFCVRPPDYPDEPVITFKNMSKNTMRQTPLGPDSILITFSFTDGNGDLGFEDNQSPSIFIVDGRDSFSKPPYRIPFIGQQGTGNGISGEISIVLPTTCCIYFPPNGGIPQSCEQVPIIQDTLFYWINIEDRAGHKSNTIRTDPIYLKCKE